MQHQIQEELQQLIPANLVSSEEELSDAELEFVTGGVLAPGGASVRVGSLTRSVPPNFNFCNSQTGYQGVFIPQSFVQNFRR